MPSEKSQYLCEGKGARKWNSCVGGQKKPRFFCCLLPLQHHVTSLGGTARSPQPLKIKPGLNYFTVTASLCSKRGMSGVGGFAAKVQARLESVGMHFHTQGNYSL